MAPPFIRDSTSGIWGFPTSTMDWCEENYAFTLFIAEFWNTISNFAIVVPPLLTAYHFKKNKLLEERFILSLTLLSVVGIGSFTFHCTLLYHSQLLDELPMIYGTCSMLYAVLECNGKENEANQRTVLFLTLVSIVVTGVYVTLKNPLLFLWCYGLLSATLTVLHIRASIIYNGDKKLLALSTLSVGIGFILWNIDNEFCYQVRDVRSSLPVIIQPIVQLHAWWHILAGLGTYLCVMYSIKLRITCLCYKPKLKFLYKILPYYEKNYSNAKAYTRQLDIDGSMSSMKLKNTWDFFENST